MENLILVGVGPMAVAYAEVLIALNQPFIAVGRGEQSAKEFEKKTKVKPILGGLAQFLDTNQIANNTRAIIATGTEVLMSSLLMLTKKGVSKILIEKPAAISIEELLDNESQLSRYSENIFVAYNRRFYASVIEAQRLIKEDDGILSMHFEFTEWAHKIEPLEKAKGVKENWFFANSTHVVDLAFYLSGKPKDWSAFSKKGDIKWHEKTNFSGAGITEKGVIFSYLSNWESAGRWSIELLTKNRRIYLKPLEGLMTQQKGSVEVVNHEFDLGFDISYKPGLFHQVEAFYNDEQARLVPLAEHIDNSKHVYKVIID